MKYQTNISGAGIKKRAGIKWKRFLGAVLFSLPPFLAAGCALDGLVSFVSDWTHDNYSEAQFAADKRECDRYADGILNDKNDRGELGFLTVQKAMIDRNKDFNRCMEEKGYRPADS